MKIKQIIAALVATTTLATTSLSVDAANYHFYGNQAIADGEINGIIEGSLLNIGELGCEILLPFNPTDSDVEILTDILQDQLADMAGVDKILDYVNCLEWCYYAFADFGTSLGELSKALREEYVASVNCYYTTPLKGCIRLADAAISSGKRGNVVPKSTLDGAQNLINESANDVKQLRKMSNMGKYYLYRNELCKMADSLERMYKSIDLTGLYQAAYKLSQAEKNAQKYETIYNSRTIGTSGALAVVGMAHGKLKGSKTSEYDVYCANRYREDIYWACTESALKLDDQVTKFSSNMNTSDKINRLIALASNAQSGLVIQINKSNNDQLRYLLAVGGDNGDLLVLDPISGSSKPVTLNDMCNRYGLNYNTTVSRILTVWSYAWA